MTGKTAYDWDALLAKARDLVREGRVRPLTWKVLAEGLGMPYSTLNTNFKVKFNIHSIYDLASTETIGPALKNTVHSVERTNTLEVSGNARLVYTLDELLDSCQVDLETWQVKDYLVNQWQYGTRDGEVYPLYQVKAWLIRKKLQTLFPLTAPINLRRIRKKDAPAKQGTVRRVLVISDLQVGFRRRLHTSTLVPFHDRRVLDLALQLARSSKFDEIAFLGDSLDLSEWSTKYTPEAEFFWTTQPALIELAWWLREFRAAARSARIIIFEGNHDKRMQDMINTHMRAAYDLRPADELELPPSLSVERLLALHKMDIEYILGYPDGKLWLNDKVVLRHGDVVRAGAGDSAKAVINKSIHTTVFGHIHRRELVSRKLLSRDSHDIYTAFCPGCACHIDGRVPGSTEDHQWQQGIGIIEYTDESENVLPIAIDEGRMIYSGKEFKAESKDAEIDDMLGEILAKLAGD